MEKLLTVPEVAELLRCKPLTVYRLVGRGEIASVKVGRLIRIPAGVVERMVSHTRQEEPASVK